MRKEIKELHALYCQPKPNCIVKIYNTELEPYPADDSEIGNKENNSLDIYVNLVV